ncbi:MAG: hypothetical protein KJ579_09495 [Verrucomicrobia bacterium]|nr:hypothetical protein [Verrucomicrobiota bacterium]
MMMAGRWYDKNMTELGATCDLAMPTGTYDWTHVSTVVVAPTNAAYYRVYWMGIFGAGTGTGWIDLAGIRPAVE